jgi:cleavage and polyadenylation specificity factor subunit 1
MGCTGISEAIDGADGGAHDQGDIYCVICYETGALEIFDVPNFNFVFIVDKFVSGKTHLVDSFMGGTSQRFDKGDERRSCWCWQKRKYQNMKTVDLAMLRWSEHHSCPFVFWNIDLWDNSMLPCMPV